MKVAIIYPSPAPYREKFFSELSQLNNIDLTIYYCSKSSYNDLVFQPASYNKVFLKRIIPRLKINPGIVINLVKNRPDIIITWGWSFPTAIIGLLFARFLKIPSILFSDTGIRYRSFSKSINYMLNNLKKIFISLPQAFICQGELSKNYLIKLGANDNQINILPINCIDTQYWHNRSNETRINKKKVRLKYNIESNKIVLFLGMLEQRKNCEMLIEAFEMVKYKLHNIALLIAGDGPQRKYLEAKCLQHNLSKVVLLGSQPYEKLPEFCGISDCLVLPTLADHWPLVLIEALAAGLPIITTEKCGSVPELIYNNDVGRIVNSKNVQELAQAIYDVFILPESDIRGLRVAAFELSKKYDYKLAARMLSDYLHTKFTKNNKIHSSLQN